MFDRKAVETTARDAVALLLYRGEDSYDDEVINDETFRLCTSPLAGRTLSIEQMTITSAGYPRGAGNYHVIIIATINGTHVEAYCQVSCDDRKIFLVKTDIFVGSARLTSRNVSLGRGKLDPWAMPEGYDIDAAIQASTIQ